MESNKSRSKKVNDIEMDGMGFNLLPEYLLALKLIEQGHYEKAAESILTTTEKITLTQAQESPSFHKNRLAQQTSYLNESEHIIPLRNLITYRLAIKANTLPLDGKHILSMPPQSMDLVIQAEVALVNGIYLNACRLFSEAMTLFTQAKKIFKEIGWIDKFLVCSYNSIISDINSTQGLITDEQFSKLLELQVMADEYKNKKILGLVCRQKSYYYKEQKRWHAAVQEAESAISLMEGRSFVSDYHLALLNLSDCLIELGQKDKAQSYFEKIFQPIDPRVQFAYDFIQCRLSDEWTEERWKTFQIKNEIDPHFLYRASACLESAKGDDPSSEREENSAADFFWNQSLGRLRWKGQEWLLAPSSKEYLLINLLASGPKAPEFIMTVLWPLYSEKSQLVNRLHTLISRSNKKLDGIIKYSNGKYVIHGLRNSQ